MPYATPLTCGEPVEFTVYDFLQGIARRKEHRPYPEPEVAMIFKKADSDTAVDLVEVELTLRKAYTEVRAGALSTLFTWDSQWRPQHLPRVGAKANRAPKGAWCIRFRNRLLLIIHTSEC